MKKLTSKDEKGLPTGELNFNKADLWSSVQKSRHPERPYSEDYIPLLFDQFIELKGDRAFQDDKALVAGVGRLKGSPSRSVFFLGHQKGRKTKEKIKHNFGMANPEGYRKAMRIMDMAERFELPLLTFIDTPGAYPGLGAEERGQAEAIASSILKMMEIKTPTVGIVIGEGGSGGALAIGTTDKLLMLEHATYSVISPESCAAILWSDATQAPKAASALKLNANSVLKLGICDKIIKEAGEGAHQDPEKMSASMLKEVHKQFNELEKLKKSDLMEARYKKYRSVDQSILESCQS